MLPAFAVLIETASVYGPVPSLVLAATWKLYSVNGIKPYMVTDCSELSDCCVILSGTEPTRVRLYVYPMMIPPRSRHGGSLQEKLRLGKQLELK